MRTRSRTLLMGVGALILAIAIIGSTSSVASSPHLGIESPNAELVVGQPVVLEIQVSPTLVGGHGDLYLSAEGESFFVRSFEFTAPHFALQTTIPESFSSAQGDLSFTFQGFAPDGTPVGRTTTKPVAPLEIE